MPEIIAVGPVPVDVSSPVSSEPPVVLVELEEPESEPLVLVLVLLSSDDVELVPGSVEVLPGVLLSSVVPAVEPPVEPSP